VREKWIAFLSLFPLFAPMSFLLSLSCLSGSSSSSHDSHSFRPICFRNVLPFILSQAVEREEREDGRWQGREGGRDANETS